MKTGRKITNGPRIYMAGDRVTEAFRYPVIIEVVVEGDGIIDPGALTHAVDKASRANPGTRLIARGNLHRTRLVDTGIAPPVRLIDGSDRAGYSPAELSFYRYPLPIDNGPTCDVILRNETPARIIFRGHHTVIDGQGLMMWIEDIFRVLRGETPVGSSWIESIDQFRRLTPAKEPKWSGGQCVAPTGMHRDRTNQVVFARMELPGPVSDLMPRLMLQTARMARQHNPNGRIIFGIPVSLRHRKPEVHSSSNLSRAVYVEITPDSAITDIRRSIHHHRQTDGRLAFAEAVIPFLPLWILRKALENGYRKAFDGGRYWVSGIVSNFGRFEKKQFSMPGFTAQSVFALPPSSCSTPVFFILMGLDDAISISASMPQGLASGGRLEDLMACIRSDLCPYFTPTTASGLDPFMGKEAESHHSLFISPVIN